MGPRRFRAYVGVGGNLGNVAECIQAALQELGTLPWTEVAGQSRLYRSSPVDASGPDYINGVVALDSALGPHELLRALLRLEHLHHRERPYRHAPRTLDLDLLWFGGAQIQTRDLTLPHPRAMERAFVLEPWVQLLQTYRWPAPAGLVFPDAQQRQKLAQIQGIWPIEGPVAP